MKIYCKKCGAEVRSDDTVCAACGEALPEQTDRVLSAVGYLWILFLVPLLARGKSSFCRFHANQSLVLFIANIVLSFVGFVVSSLPIVGQVLGIVVNIIGLLPLLLMILGIVYAVQGQRKALPIIGKIVLFK